MCRRFANAGPGCGRLQVTERVPASLLAALTDLVQWLDTAKVPPMVIGGLRVHLPRIEDLLLMKAVAGRPKDLQDIEGPLAAHPNADIAVARQWIQEFATAMTMPGMLEEFNKLVARRK